MKKATGTTGSVRANRQRTGDRSANPARRASNGPRSLENIVEEITKEDAPSKNAQPELIVAVEEEEQAPVVLLVETILREALKRGASDIHIEPFEEALKIRFRIDGALQEIQSLPPKLTQAIVSRLKIMAELDICERRIPQDGCIRMRGKDAEEADFRISTLPSVHGEKIVMRVLGRTNLNRTLSDVGIPPKQLKLLRNAIARPDGIVLVTGPTGSGKTTTLYSCLTELSDPEKSLFTAEDPVEGTLPAITQVQVNSAVGLTFGSVLRALLRQDPDIILVGEIRDKETIDIAMKAALTGHLVLSTLHTNDTAATIQRILNMGVEPYLISSAVNLIVAQRLVRKICTECKEPAMIDPHVLERFGLLAESLKDSSVYKGKGCPACGGTGYSGRMPLYEVMPMTDKLKEAVLQGASTSEIRAISRREGMTTLREAGVYLVKNGITTLEEVLAKTNEDSEMEPEPQVEAQQCNLQEAS
ncbi:MAG: type II/IV secretion system protein [Bdellovibrionales bacterium]|nr:type II/IV secretion system protein [Bdellovibrionales bacterium]